MRYCGKNEFAVASTLQFVQVALGDMFSSTSLTIEAMQAEVGFFKACNNKRCVC